MHILDPHFRLRLSQMSIPEKILENEDLTKKCGKFIDKNVYWGNQGLPEVEFISGSKTSAELEEIAKKISQGHNWRVRVRCSKENFQFPSITENKEAYLIKNQYEHTDSFKETYVRIPNTGPVPDRTSAFQPGSWMIDIDIPYRPERFFYTNGSYTWKLPGGTA